MDVDYAKIDWQWHAHHARWRRRVEAIRPPLMCQDCRGAGGEVVPVLDFGQGPFETCGWCEGTGLVDQHRRGEWLADRRERKRLGLTAHQFLFRLDQETR